MRERVAGAQSALHEAGVGDDEALIRDHVKTPDDAARAVAEMLDSADPPTAFFCTNNRITVGALQELWRRGDDRVGLVGFDDFELSHLMPRPFTVIAYDTVELARTATELLFRRISGDRSWPVTLILPTRLIDSGIR
jgi:LacI family transcriptional regulator